MPDIIVDTNFFMLPFTKNVDVVSELDRIFRSYRLFVLDQTFYELEKLSRQGKFKRQAKAAIRFFNHLKKTKDLKILVSNKVLYLDKALIEMLKNLQNKKVSIKGDNVNLDLRSLLVFTADNQLRKEIKFLGLRVIFLRQGNHFEVS